MPLDWVLPVLVLCGKKRSDTRVRRDAQAATTTPKHRCSSSTHWEKRRGAGRRARPPARARFFWPSDGRSARAGPRLSPPLPQSPQIAAPSDHTRAHGEPGRSRRPGGECRRERAVPPARGAPSRVFFSRLPFALLPTHTFRHDGARARAANDGARTSGGGGLHVCLGGEGGRGRERRKNTSECVFDFRVSLSLTDPQAHHHASSS